MNRAEMKESFASFLNLVARELRGPMDVQVGLLLVGTVLLARVQGATPGSRLSSLHEVAFLNWDEANCREFYGLMLDDLAQSDPELGQAIGLLRPIIESQVTPGALCAVRDAIRHATLPSLDSPEARMALGEAYLDALQDRSSEGWWLPREVEHMMVHLARPGSADRVYVPFAEAIGLLVALGQGGFSPIKGTVRNPHAGALGILALRLHGIGIDVASVQHSEKVDGGPASVVIACPPLGLMDRDAIQALKFALPKLAGSLPDQALRDFAGLFQALHSVAPGGRAVVLTSPSILFRIGAVSRLRGEWIREDTLEAVIALPRGVLRRTGIQMALLVFNQAKPEARRGKVLFVNVDEDEAQRGKRRPSPDTLPADIARVQEAFDEYREIPGFARIVALNELADDWNLAPARYVTREAPQEPRPDLRTLHDTLVEAEVAADVAGQRLDLAIKDLLDAL